VDVTGIILELLLNGHNPAALVFEDEEFILTLGVIVAHEVFARSIPIIILCHADFVSLSKSPWAHIVDGTAEPLPVPTQRLPKQADAPLKEELVSSDVDVDPGFRLSHYDSEALIGAHGQAVKVAARVILRMAAVQGAQELIDITQVHIDSCVYTGPATLRLAQQFVEWRAKVRVPASLNSISVDRLRWRDQGVDPLLGDPAIALADAYIAMGAKQTYTCAPYLLDTAPSHGEQITWAESNAAVYANSVLGARTTKCPDFLDLCIALTGRAPNTGCHVAENRKAQVKVVVEQITGIDDAFFPLLGYVVGDLVRDKIPIIVGLEKTAISLDDLKGLSAAFATTSSAPMFHVAGRTPEASTGQDLIQQLSSVNTTVKVTHVDLIDGWQKLNSGRETAINLISFGNPHFSFDELSKLAELCHHRKLSDAVAVIVTCGRASYERAYKEGIITKLEAFGAQILSDTCWCMILEPIIPKTARTIMTNSGKYAHYGPGLSGRGLRFGSLGACLDAACSGHASHDLPSWLRT
jgi:predicted aconitase